MALRFKWNRTKAAVNKAKHGVAFSEAATVFDDELALLIDDPDHSDTEERFVLVGLSAQLRVLVVVHSYLDDDQVIRLISAREATKGERQTYARRS